VNREFAFSITRERRHVRIASLFGCGPAGWISIGSGQVPHEFCDSHEEAPK